MKNFLKINRALVAKKKITFLFALLCASVMGFQVFAAIAPNTDFWTQNYQWQEIDGVTPPSNVLHIESHNGYDCLYVTFVDAAFNRDYITGGVVYAE